MQKVKFIKNHPSRRFKKGDIVEMPDENIEAWLASGYINIDSPIIKGDDLGNEFTPMKEVGDSKKSSANGGKSRKKSGSKNKRNKK